MRAVVTGGAGFIGSTLVDRLLGDGHQVLAIDDLSTGSEANLVAARDHGERFELARLDIRDPAVADAIASFGPEVVFHLAAQADVRVSVREPVFDADVNVLGSLRVIEAARAAGARKVVFASSGGTIYGEADPARLPIAEDHPQRPLSPYGIAKKVVVEYLWAFGELHGLEHASLALGNVYGPRQDPHGEAGVVAIFAGQLLAGEPCTVFGTGEQTRDFVFVTDVVDAFVRAADAGTGLYNIGTGRETSVNQVYRALADAADCADDARFAPPRVGELERSALASDRAAAELGWRATVPLDEGCRSVFAWYRAR